MLERFERRLADTLGSNLQGELAGAVDPAPGRPEARVIISVRRAEPQSDDLLSTRPEVVPGSPASRRVVRLHTEVGIEVRAIEGVTRGEQFRSLDSVLYALDNAPFRSGRALDNPDEEDTGFLIRRMALSAVEPPSLVKLEADGLFWPPGLTGETGVEIDTIRLRVSQQPLRLIPEQPLLVAGGSPVELTVEVALNEMEITPEGIGSSDFGPLNVRVVDAGGRPGAGTLAGGNDGPDSGRLLTLSEGEVVFQYTPPAEPAREELLVTVMDGEGGRGIEIGRFPLKTRSV